MEEDFVMDVKEFCGRLAEKMGQGPELADDFEWLIECAVTNAYYGYGPQELFESNHTARHLNVSEEMHSAILACGRVGFYTCAEDEDMVCDVMRKALA